MKKKLIICTVTAIGCLFANEIGNANQKIEVAASEIRFSNDDSVKVSNVPLKIDPVSGDTQPENYQVKERKIYVYVPNGYEVTVVPY